MAAARAATGLDEAVLCVAGAIEGHPVVVAAMDFEFMGGSLSGARMQEGAIALMQMAKTSRLDDAGVLTISLVTDPTFGGVLRHPVRRGDRRAGRAPRVRRPPGDRADDQADLPPDFQTAEFLLANGLIDMIRQRQELRPTLARLLAIGTTRPDLPPAPDEQSDGEGGDPWQVVQRARDLGRPTTLDYLGLILDDFEELRGDRLGADCPAIVTILIANRGGNRPPSAACMP